MKLDRQIAGSVTYRVLNIREITGRHDFSVTLSNIQTKDKEPKRADLVGRIHATTI